MAYFRKIGKSWYYSVRITDSCGVRRTIERFGGETKREAQQASLDFLATCETTGRCVKIATMKYSAYLDEFVKLYVKPNLKENTKESYIRAIDNNIKPMLGDYALNELTPMNIQMAINELSKKYSHGSVDQILGIIKRSLRYAVEFFSYLSTNPAKSVRLPKKKADEKTEDEFKVFGVEEIETIFKYFPPTHPFFAPTRLAWLTGMRIGECLGLQWSDIDMERQIIHVRHTLHDRHGLELGTPKTKGSVRIIPFGKKLKDVLEKIRTVQEKRKASFAGYYEVNDFVCTKRDGSVMTADGMRFLGNWCKHEFGFGSFHTLRHSHATFLLAEGWSIEDVSKRLGHANPIITSSVYSHITKERIKNQIKQLEKLSM